MYEIFIIVYSKFIHKQLLGCDIIFKNHEFAKEDFPSVKINPLLL